MPSWRSLARVSGNGWQPGGSSMGALNVALYDLVRQTSTLTALGGRIYPLLAPTQAVMPFAVYSEIAYRAEHTLVAVSALAWATYQWDLYGQAHQAVHDLALALTTALDGWRGVQSGVAIRRVTVHERRLYLLDDLGGGQQQYYRASLECEVCYLLS